MATSRNANPYRNAPTATAAFDAIRQAAGRATVVYFTKRTTGKERRMVLLYDEELAAQQRHRFNIAKKQLLLVWDIEKRARRYVSLDAVHRVLAGGEVLFDANASEANASDRQPRRQDSRPEKRKRRSFEELQRQAKELF